MQGRLDVLAASHRFISPRQVASGEATQATTLEELVRTILSPHVAAPTTGKIAQIVIDGPETPIKGEAVTNIAMIIHELATNAVKYGAFSMPAGQVFITWTVQKGQFSLTWKEQGGPKLKRPPERQGFGTRLVHQSVNGSFNGQLTYHWNTEGLMVYLTTRVERLTSSAN